MKILLIVPKISTKGNHIFPIGLPYISSSLKKAGYDVHCLNLNNFRGSAESVVAKTVAYIRPNVVGTGGLSVHYNLVKEVVSATRLVLPVAKVIVGGGIISSEPELMLKALDADFGIIGEGEKTVVELIQAIKYGLNLSEVKGIVYKYDSDGVIKIIKTPDRPPIKYLDELPWPDYEGFGIMEHLNYQRITDFAVPISSPTIKPRMIEMISSRSCPYDCSFCFHPLGKIYRERSLDNFFQELEYLISKFDINALAVLDELFAVDRQRLLEFCTRIKKYNLKWMVQLRVDIVSEDILDLMKDSGCAGISYGIESISENVLMSMKKKIKPLDIEKALNMTYIKKINIQGNFIFGDTSETYQTAMETLKWWLTHRKFQLNLAYISHYPGTKIYRDAIAKGIISDSLAFIQCGCPPINTTSMDDSTYKNLTDWIVFLHYVLIIPARLISYELADTMDQQRGKSYSISCICPHCGQYNFFPSLPVDEIFNDRKTFRLACNECAQRFDIPKLIPEPNFDDYINLLFDLSVQSFQNNNLSYSITLLNKIISINKNHSKAYYLLGEICYINADYINAFRLISQALRIDPTFPFYHRLFADILVKLHLNDDANIFYNQAEILDKALLNSNL
jgi:radical SAM superfamily enzyme YgiQ (UPF0313 family)